MAAVATSDHLEQIERELRNLRSPSHLQRFFAERDYAPDHIPLPLPDSPDLASRIAEPPRILNQAHGFQIIYTALAALSRADERALIAYLLPRHPYALFVFSDAQHSAWHFVNVKLIQGDATDSKLRRLFRRISISPDDRLRTACERLAQIDLRHLTGTPSALAIQKLHDDAFDVEAVTKQFFKEYRRIFEAAERHISGVHGDSRRIFTQRLFNRLMFILFLERKGLLKFPGQRERDYLRALWQAHQRQARADFYTERLKPLFFTGLNTPNAVNIPAINRAGALQQIIGDVPYLNGGLFERAPEDENDAIGVPDQALAPAIDDLFYRYNFTVTESTPFDVEVAVDPEMLGKIFEELVVGRHETGSYYTPKSIVSFMCRAALKSYLQVRCGITDEQALDAFIEEDDARHLPDPEAVLDALRAVRICDPACGSGAYLLGMMQELLRLRHALFTAKQLDSQSVYDRKLEIIQKNLYGVDSDPFAVNIAQLRLWLSLIVDYESEAPPPPLPNLDYKIEVGNSLTAPAPMPLQPDLVRHQQIKRFLELKGAYLKAHGESKKALREQIERLRAEIREWMLADRRLKDVEGFDWQVEFAECFAAEQDSERGFDIVIANPPYIRQELIKS
ncbi:MAG: class I SAM-dependent DNA methyltransferase, partial [Chloroflexi bacterium]|nr:class I SAM-dependent DNA methyltransferase [Chloroflexota bacterium]